MSETGHRLHSDVQMAELSIITPPLLEVKTADLKSSEHERGRSGVIWNFLYLARPIIRRFSYLATQNVLQSTAKHHAKV